MHSAAQSQTTLRSAKPALRRGNTLVLVTAILVLLVILATAFLVRSRSARAQATAENRAAGRQDRVQSIADAVTQEIGTTLFVQPVDTSSYNAQVAANTTAGVTGWPLNIPRSDYPRLLPDPAAIRYGVDYFDVLDNATLATIGGGDGFLDGFNYAPYSVIPWTNWPDVYTQAAFSSDGTVLGEGNPVGNPGFGDTRWLRSTEPVRALTMAQSPTPRFAVPPCPPAPQLASAAPANNWSNLALNNGIPVLSPEGFGFSHWAHLSWLPTASNGFRVCYDISDLEAYTLAGFPGTPAGLNALGIPYEQWPTNVAPREVGLTGKDSRGYLVLARSVGGGGLSGDWIIRRNNWFTNYTNTLLGLGGAGPATEAMPNYLQLGAFGDPSDEFKLESTGPLAGYPTSRNLISRTLADADGDGFTDSFWYVAPTSSDRDTRQVVAVCITDNTGKLNVNIASRFERTSSNGMTPSDVALVSRGVSMDPSVYTGGAADGQALADRISDDFPVGFLDARENDPEYRLNRADAASNPAMMLYSRVLDGGGAPVAGVDVGFNPARWEGRRVMVANPAVNGESTDMPGFLQSIGVIRSQGSSTTGANQPLFIFDPSFSQNLPAPGGAGYGGWFPLTTAADRLTYFKTMANGGVLVDPVASSPLAQLTPFGVDDELELRGAESANNAASISRLEMALGAGAPVVAGSGGAANVNARDFLRGSRSREETVRHLIGVGANQANDPRSVDARSRIAWSGQSTSMAASGAGELVFDQRRKLTTVNGARNEMMPPRLWTVIDPSAPNDLMRVRPAFVHRGVDFDHDGNPDDVNGDGSVNAGDDLAPSHPYIVFFSATPRGDGNGDGVVNLLDYELARQEFLRRNRKIDLRRPMDIPTGNGVAATAAAILQAQREFGLDIQRVLRRALIDEDTRGSYFLDGAPAGASASSINEALTATKLMAASMAANVVTYRDGERDITNVMHIDGPVHPDDATSIPADAIADPQFSSGRFIGVEKQPFLQEVFIAFVYPKTKLTQTELDNVTGPPGNPNTNCPDAAGCQLDSGDEYKLPPCTENGAGEHFVTYDPADSSTWPAVVFVAQIANPYNEPVNLADFELRVNPATGQPQRFFFGLPGPAGTRSGNTYGPDVELGPCTPEEPRTAIVFCVPEKFPNGEAFPRDAWLDYLDIGAPITDTNPSNDVKPGNFFAPDNNAIFTPAWGGPSAGSTAYWDARKRNGTLYFDATRTVAPQPVWAGGFDISGNMSRWQPDQSAGGPPPSSYIELRRALYRQTGGLPTWTVVDRLDNELDPGDQIFRDTLGRLFTPEHLPPQKDIACRQGKLAISGVRIRQNDYYTTWARGARQWLFDTQNNVAGTPAPLGKGLITLDERTPRYGFSRLTGVERVQEVQSDSYNGGVSSPVKGSVWAEADNPDGVGGGQPWILMDYVNQWGETKRGKPTFFPTRIIEEAAGKNRLYTYPAWMLSGGNPPAGTLLSYGEKGVTDAKFVDGTDPHNFMAPFRFYQKDADFDQVAEILDVPLWGPLVESGGGAGRTFATLPEILAQEPNSTASLKFPKAPKAANLAYWNRLQIDAARFDINPGPGGRPNLLSGVPVVPSPVGFISPQQAGLSLLDAFTVDDRGATRFDTDASGFIDFNERAAAENRRLRLAQGFLGKATPGLININTAPLEVMRAMPLMDRLAYNDDREPYTRARLHLANDLPPNPAPYIDMTPRERRDALPGGAGDPMWDYGSSAPRVRLAEAIDLWRNKGNVTPALGATVADPAIPSYFTRGLDLPDAQNNLEHAPGLRRERGFDSLGELALLTLGSRFADPVNPAAVDVGDSWNQFKSWSTRYAGQDPYRYQYSNAVGGVGVYSNWTPTTVHRTDGIPASGLVGSTQEYEGMQNFPVSGRTGVDTHLLKISTDDLSTTSGPNPIEPTKFRVDLTAGDALEQNQLLKAISNIATVRSDVFTVHLRVRTLKRNPITGRWDATDPDYILDDSRYVMGVDRSQVDRPGEKPKVLYFAKVPN